MTTEAVERICGRIKADLPNLMSPRSARYIPDLSGWSHFMSGYVAAADDLGLLSEDERRYVINQLNAANNEAGRYRAIRSIPMNDRLPSESD
ncbi:hypothetical protein [uncultured Stenotrophomonas sp.]|uniref:hypothetical protein n=1 Tax=uncultured Stenotrophomonas sp. TaxID=165438 RepID=UPI002600811B|nr:hypothetical protein [uncultured Stenotrophomonas sp.]